uniref:Uncharacterized protein n=1 Tax=Mycena chlorophos TaxID=658473 RepID=A0ABQ0M4F9_MYCCL|nr:predicted protein [Mycena chlorophos]
MCRPSLSSTHHTILKLSRQEDASRPHQPFRCLLSIFLSATLCLLRSLAHIRTIRPNVPAQRKPDCEKRRVVEPRRCRINFSVTSFEPLPSMGNSGSGPDQPRPTTRLNHDTPPFQPKFTRTDSTTAEVGSDHSMSDKSANSSFPLSEAALPTTFDTSDDFSTSQLSHFFPLPPTKLNNSNSPSLNNNIDRPRPSLQETLDAIWAPPKASASIRISAPPTPQNTTQPELEPLIDLSDDSSDGLSTLPTFRTASSVTTLAMASLSIDTSFDPLTAVAWSPKPPRMDNNEGNNSSGSIRMDNGETIPSPVTYADAANIASKYPELRGKVLKEPLASPTSSPRSAKPELVPVVESGVANASVVSINSIETVSLPCTATTTAAPAHTADRPNWALAPDEPDAEVDRHRERRPQARRDQSARDRPSSAPKPSYTPQTQNGSRAREWRDHQGARDHSSPASQTQIELDDKWGYTAADENQNQSQNLNQNNDHEYHNARNGPARQRSEQQQQDQAPNPNTEQPPDIPMVMGQVHPSRARNLAASGFSGPPPPPPRDTTAPRQVQNEFTATHDAWAVPQSPQRQPEPLPRNTQAPNSGADEWTTTHDGWAVQQQQSPQRCQEPLPSQSESPGRPIQQQNHTSSPGRREDDWMPTRDAWAVQQSQSPQRRADDLPQHQRPSNDTWSVPQYHQPRDEFVPAPRDPSPARPRADEWTASHDPWAVSASRNTTPRNEPRPLPPADDGYNNNGHFNQHDENYAYDRSSRLLEPEQKSKQDFEEVQQQRHKSPSPFRDRMNDGVRDHDSFSHGSVLEVRRAPAQSSIAELAASRAHGYEENNTNNNFTQSTAGDPPAEFDYFLHSNTMSWTDEPAKPQQESTRSNMFSPTQRIMSPTRAVPDENAPSNNYTSRSEIDDKSYSQPRYNDSGPADNSFNSRGHSGSATRHGHEQDRGRRGEDDRFVLGGLKSAQRGADDFAARWGRDGVYSSSQQDRYDSAPKDNWGPTPRNDSYSQQEQKKESWAPVETKEEQWGGTPSGSDSRNRDWETPATKDRHGGGEYSNSKNSHDRDQHGNSSFGSSSTSSTGSGYRRNGPLPSQWDEFSRYCDARGIPRDRFGHGGGGGGGYGRS